MKDYLRKFRRMYRRNSKWFWLSIGVGTAAIGMEIGYWTLLR